MTVRTVLFLCTANSARSIVGEALMRDLGGGRFRSFSAGSTPRGMVNPDALALLKSLGHTTEGLASKSWDVFAGPHAPCMDLVVTVCDAAAGEACPIWPGHPLTVHWGIEDPAAATGAAETRRAAFQRAYDRMARRIAALIALGDAVFSAPDACSRIQAIGDQAARKEIQ